MRIIFVQLEETTPDGEKQYVVMEVRDPCEGMKSTTGTGRYLKQVCQNTISLSDDRNDAEIYPEHQLNSIAECLEQKGFTVIGIIPIRTIFTMVLFPKRHIVPFKPSSHAKPD